MTQETSMGEGHIAFEPTLWTLVLRARDHSRPALEQLLRRYWRPLYFFVRRKGSRVEDAKDLVQGFFENLLSRNSLRAVCREKGRFRTYLLTALNRYWINQTERANAAKRGAGRLLISLDFEDAEREFVREPASPEDLDRYFRRKWGLALLNQTLERLSKEMDPEVFEALKPHLAGGPPYEETAQRLGVSKARLNNLIHRTRKRYRILLQEQVAGSVSEPAMIEEELSDLFDALKS